MLPGGGDALARRVAERVAQIGLGERTVEKQDAVRRGVGQVGRGRIEHPLAARPKPPQRHADCKADVIGRRLRVQLFDILRQCAPSARSTANCAQS